MKNLLVRALVVGSVIATSGFALAQSAIEGSWGMQQSDNGFTFDITFTITATSVTITNVCTQNGASATAHVTVPASYDATTLNILGADQDNESANGVNCNVSAQVESMNYTIQGNTLSFTQDGAGQGPVLTRR